MIRKDLRNIAIIAHVDHGKTTLVDEMLKQSGAFRDNQIVAERVMDSGDLERERGITILAKNTSCMYKDVKINIVDTPGHADFGGEVERVLKMVDGVLLLVDAAEGPMPQTRFVLEKALSLGLMLIVVVNKIDRPDARIDAVVDEVLELLMDLGATNEQLDSPMVFCSGRDGTASYSPHKAGTDLSPLFDTIVSYIKPPEGDENAPLGMLVSCIDYNEFVGRIAIGRISSGRVKIGQEVVLCDYHKPELNRREKITSIFEFENVKRQNVDTATVGDIVAISGIGDVNIGNTLCAPEKVEPIPFVKISEPTVEMTFSVNDSPFAGTEGKYVTSRQLGERLFRELLRDVSLIVKNTDTTDSFRVVGRGEMHLSILIETMRREGYEFQVGPPKAILKTIDGQLCEPYELFAADVPGDCVGNVMMKLGARKGELVQMVPQGARTKLEFSIPSRGLFGYRNEFLTDTRGEGIMSAVFDKYAPYKGDIQKRSTGSLVAFETGEAVGYGLFNAQDRGSMFVSPGDKVYAGMVVGECPKNEDIVVNVCKKKHVSNMRASGSDEALRLTPARQMSLEQCIEFISDDELLEVTPKSLRMRKTLLDHAARARETAKKKN
ncbi:MAG: translational GTPase TypA [Oscillospiraceae bacterium]|nr:translational GTPase TypA [Oscillospiraceae bacterium]